MCAGSVCVTCAFLWWWCVCGHCRSAWLDFATHFQPLPHHFPSFSSCVCGSVKITAATTTATATTERVQHGELHYFCENLLNMPNTQRCMQSGISRARWGEQGWVSIGAEPVGGSGRQSTGAITESSPSRRGIAYALAHICDINKLSPSAGVGNEWEC